MPRSVELNGKTYNIPEKGDTDWDNSLTNWVVDTNDLTETFRVSGLPAGPANYTSAYNGGIQFGMGTRKFWIDANNRLRVKTGTPSSDLDGKVVGPIQYINVRDYGATGDGSTDDTAAINLALAAVFAANQTVNPGAPDLPSFTQPTLFFPAGVYNISTALSVFSKNIYGEGAIIVQTNPANDILTNMQYEQFEVSGIRFRGGRYAFYMDHNGVADCVTHIRDCEFIGQQLASIKVVDSGSSHLSITNCHFWTSQGHIMDLGQCDHVVVEDCMLGNNTPEYAFVVDTAQLHIRNCSGGPGPDSAGTNAWFKMTNSAAMHIQECRFGGEPGAKTIVDVYEGAADNGRLGWLRVENCATYSGTNPSFRFYSLPQSTVIKNNIGDSFGMWFDPSMPAAIKRTIGTNTVFDWDGSGGKYTGRTLTHGTLFPRTAGNDNTVSSALVVSNHIHQSPFVLTADRVRTVLLDRGSYGLNTAGANVAGVNGVTPYGEKKITWTDDGTGTGYLFNNYETTLTGLATGIYTAVWELEAAQGLTVDIAAGAVQKRVCLAKGHHIVSMPFYYDSTNVDSHAQMLSMAAYFIPAGGSVGVGPYRVFSGHHNITTPNTIVYGSAAPTSERWCKGDRVHNTAPAASGNEGWICVTTGVVAPAWQATTAYVIGDRVLNDTNNVYQCTVAGTSAGSGGPTTTSPSADGTVTWVYIDELAVFKTFGAIAA